MAEPQPSLGPPGPGEAGLADHLNAPPAPPAQPAPRPAQDAWDQIEPTICIAVPGLWPGREQLARQLLIESQRRFVFLGDAIIRASDLKHFPCDLVEHDPDLAGVIRAVGQGRIPEPDMQRIARHTYTLYVRCEGGATDCARAVADATSALVRAGGLAVKVESSHVAHSSADWLKRTDPAHPTGLYWAFVSLVNAGNASLYSTGMHNFGLRDAVTDVVWDLPNLTALLHGFLGMTFTDRPTLVDGQKFLSNQGVKYTIRSEPCTTFPRGHMQHNPYGMWRLELIE